MERHLIFMGWKTNCYDGNATQSNLQIQYNPYKNSNGLFCKNGKTNSNSHEITTQQQKANNQFINGQRT